MVEVDVFWAYGIGAGFALAGAAQLRPRPVVDAGSGEPAADDTDPRPDPWLLTATLYCAALFAPSGAWLLWGFPSWETMHVGTYETIPAWLVALFAATNTTQGVAGFLVTRWLLRSGRRQWAAFQLIVGYFGMFFILVHGWDGKGYERFFSETRDRFDTWDSRPVLTNVGDWVGTDVALTLYGMGAVLLPVMFVLYVRWHQAGRRLLGLPATAGSGWAYFGTFHALVWVAGLGGAIVASVLIHLLGWWVGGALAIAAGLALFVPGRGPLGGAARLMVPEPLGAQAPPEPVGTPAAPGVPTVA